ncbi:MAG: nicotinate-nucleotide adenylyltransferase [Christensenellales bacterium]|jgi:nicotinate-nucleotide adenylyltransferase|nr:nicotinate-nucleotide adenylyltransferase [Clostridiales bacterium]MEE0159745.1 nicotinate-nucleotide adenylyltransferase [Christensenellales bacterium]
MPEIGLMGGSFNPIHCGHVALARAALESGRVERVLFLPTGNPPHKKEGLADKFDRLRMVELAVEHEAGMAVCREEIDRDGVIYTVDTLAALKRKMPDCTLTYLIGADTLRALGTWRRVETVIERCKFLVMMREGETREEVIRLAGLWTQRGAQIDFLDARKMDISSTQIREQIQKGLPFERLVPQAVADYIHEHGLYGAKTGMELNR